MGAAISPFPALETHRSLPTRRLLQLLSILLTASVAAAWFQYLRPSSLGGPATYVIVSGTSMLPALEDGDLVVAFTQDAYAVGDVIVYRVPSADPGGGTQIVHRVTGLPVPGRGYLVRGDNREGVDYWRPAHDEILGKMRLSVPRAGSWFVWLRTPLGMAFLAALATMLLALALLEDGGRSHSKG